MNLNLMIRTDCYVTTYCVYQYYLCFLLILMIMLILCWNPSNVIRSYTCLHCWKNTDRTHSRDTCHIVIHTKYPTKSTKKQKHKCPRHLNSVLFFFTCFTIDGKVPSTVYTRVIFEKINQIYKRLFYPEQNILCDFGSRETWPN